MIANAVVDILLAEGVFPTLKYEDDLKMFRCPLPSQDPECSPAYSYDRKEVLRRVAPLGVPWHKEKGDPEFLFITTFIGFEWDLVQRRVSLPEVKRLKFLNRVRFFIDNFSGHRCSLREVERIHGSLCHISFVHVAGRSYLPALSNFATSFKGSESDIRWAPKSVFTALRWWLITLSVANVYRDLTPRGPLQDLELFVDASTSWSIGICIGPRWAAYKLRDSWKVDGRDICWLEMLALEFLIYILDAMNTHSCNLLIHSDNQGAIGALNKGRSGNHFLNDSVRRIYAVLIPRSITFQLDYIESELNPADPISRGELGPPELRIPVSFSMPDELANVFFPPS